MSSAAVVIGALRVNESALLSRGLQHCEFVSNFSIIMGSGLVLRVLL